MICDSVNLHKFLVEYDDGETQEIEYNLKFGDDITYGYEWKLEQYGEEKAREYLVEMVLEEESSYGAVSVKYLDNREIKFQQFK